MIRTLSVLRLSCIIKLLTVAFKQPEDTLEPRIINGTEARVEDTKHLVSIRLKKYDRNFGSGHICGGSLIAPNKVLTAAHCLYK